MITINAVNRSNGQVILSIEYTTDNGNEIIEVDAEQIVARLIKIRELLGREPSLSEAQEVVVVIINEIREGKEPLVDVVPWENYIGVDLEA
jgi:predicted regulator of amino acid metabolism with ACT domain